MHKIVEELIKKMVMKFPKLPQPIITGIVVIGFLIALAIFLQD